MSVPNKEWKRFRKCEYVVAVIQNSNTEIKLQRGKVALGQYNFEELLKIIWEGSEEVK